MIANGGTSCLPLDVELQPRGGEEEEGKLWLPPLQRIANQAHLVGAGGGGSSRLTSNPQPDGEVVEVAAYGIFQLQAAATAGEA